MTFKSEPEQERPEPCRFPRVFDRNWTNPQFLDAGINICVQIFARIAVAVTDLYSLRTGCFCRTQAAMLSALEVTTTLEGAIMSSISSFGGSSSLQFLQQLSSTNGSSQTGGSNPLEAKFEAAVKDSGGSNVNFSDLQKQIESAVKSVVQNASSSTDPSSLGSQVQTAVNQVLTANGIDVSKLQSEIGTPPSGGAGGPPPGPPPSGAAGTSSSSSSSTSSDLSSLLSSLSSSSSTTSTNNTSSTASSSSSTDASNSTQTEDQLVQQLLQDVFKNMPAGTLVNQTA